MSACSDYSFTLPKGPKGDKGDRGSDGLSAYEIWKDQVLTGKLSWAKDKTEVSDFFAYLKGAKGDTGASAYDMWKEMVTAGTPNPRNPQEQWPKDRTNIEDFWNFLSGRDGNTPYIGDNGHWWIGNTDTGKVARGEKGEKGDKGDRGKQGASGKSAYEEWREAVLAGTITWDKERTSLEHFFQFLKGKDGKNGRDGIDGKNGSTPYIGANGNWYIDGEDTGVKAKGLNGSTPRIGTNGHWWIDGADTGVKAVGTDGAQGQSGASGATPRIGANGNWFIGDVDTNVPARGTDGQGGKSAYQLWTEDVAAGRIIDPKTGMAWSKDQTAQEDFWRFLKGQKGDEGKSAYQVWKEAVLKGNIPDPNDDQNKWPTTRTSEADFYLYLAGKDGATGQAGPDGLSAYEFWKQDLKRRCGTEEALRDRKTGNKWECSRDGIDDFWYFLRGKDGDGITGDDGKPGPPGQPGATVRIIYGEPNVIAQYSNKEFGEYVHEHDGSVCFKVYDDKGQIAPGAEVQGLPGVETDQVFTADQYGSFYVSKELLPWISEVNKRWGRTKKVTINGKTTESARNTYVPNRVKVRLVMKNGYHVELSGTTQTHYLTLERKTSPDVNWEWIPPFVSSRRWKQFSAYEVTDPNNYKTYDLNKKMPYATFTPSALSNDCYITVKIHRYVLPNPTWEKNWNPDFFQGNYKYYTVVGDSLLYGEKLDWNGVVKLTPTQMGPRIKSLHLQKLITASNGEEYFENATGELDYTAIDFKHIYKTRLNATAQANQTLYEPVVEEENLVKSKREEYVTFELVSPKGKHFASSSNQKTSPNSPSYSVVHPYLDATVNLATRDGNNWISNPNPGKLRRSKTTNEYYVEQPGKNVHLEKIAVTYSAQNTQ